MKKVLPHLTFAMALSIFLLVYLDDRNPMMRLIHSTAGRWYLYIFGALVLIASTIQIIEQHQNKDR